MPYKRMLPKPFELSMQKPLLHVQLRRTEIEEVSWRTQRAPSLCYSFEAKRCRFSKEDMLVYIRLGEGGVGTTAHAPVDHETVLLRRFRRDEIMLLRQVWHEVFSKGRSIVEGEQRSSRILLVYLRRSCFSRTCHIVKVEQVLFGRAEVSTEARQEAAGNRSILRGYNTSRDMS